MLLPVLVSTVCGALSFVTACGEAKAETQIDLCSSRAVQVALKTVVISEFRQKTNFRTVFDLDKSNFQIIDARRIGRVLDKVVCQGRFITSFFVKTGITPEPKTMTALSSLARYEVSTLADSPHISVGGLHQIGGQVLVCYHDDTCGPMSTTAPFAADKSPSL